MNVLLDILCQGKSDALLALVRGKSIVIFKAKFLKVLFVSNH